MNNLMTEEELALIETKLSLLHRTGEDWAAIKAFLPNRDVIVMESEAMPSKGHMTIADGALLAFTTMEKCTAWIDKAAPKIRFMTGSMPYAQAMDVADDNRMPLYLDIRHDWRFLCYQNNQLSARMLVNTKKLVAYGKTKIGSNDPCPCGSGKKYKICCGR